MHDCSMSNALAMEKLQYCTKPSLYSGSIMPPNLQDTNWEIQYCLLNITKKNSMQNIRSMPVFLLDIDFPLFYIIQKCNLDIRPEPSSCHDYGLFLNQNLWELVLSSQVDTNVPIEPQLISSIIIFIWQNVVHATTCTIFWLNEDYYSSESKQQYTTSS